MSENENNEGSQGQDFSLNADQMEELVDRLAERLQAPAPTQTDHNPQQPTRIAETTPILKQFASELMEDQHSLMKPLFVQHATEGVLREVPVHHLGSEGSALLQQAIGKLSGTQLKQFVEGGAHVLLAKAIAYDQLTKGKSSIEAAPQVRGPSGDGIGSPAARVDDLPASVKAEITEFTKITGREPTIDELRDLGILQ